MEQDLDAAVGDTEIMAYRYQYVDFSQPYVSSGLVMVVSLKPDRVKRNWMFMKAFTKKTWLLMLFMHLSICSIVWLIENEHGQNPEFKGFGAMLWYSTTVLFFAHSKSHYSIIQKKFSSSCTKNYRMHLQESKLRAVWQDW